MNDINKSNNKFNNNNIYKLIKRAKDDNCISDDPIKKIIPNPIKFVYSFTLNSKNEPEKEEQIKYEESSEDIHPKNKKEQKNDEDKKLIKNIKNNEIESESYRIKNNKLENKNNSYNKNLEIGNDEKQEHSNSKTKIINKLANKTTINNTNENLKEIKNKNKSKNKINNINNLNVTNKTNENNKNKKNTNNQNKLNEKNIDFLNKKRNEDTINKKNEKFQNNNNKKKPENKNLVKNNLIHQVYNSKNINLWEESSDDESNNQNNNQQKNILPIHKQIEFIQKSKDSFNKPDVAKKSDYDRDLDKGKLKKIHKNKITFKQHKNYFQKISNKIINKQKK